MTSRTIMRHQEWTLQPDREPDAEPTTYAMQCAVCGETSPPGTDFNANGVRLHSTPHFGAPTNGLGYIGDGIDQLGNTSTGTDVYTCRGHQDPWWNKVRDRRTGVVGWTPQCFINFK